MPLVRISLAKGKPRDYIRAISNGVHEALVEAFKVPVDDRFQLIQQYERDDFIYDSGYLGIDRSDDVVFIHITASDWRDLPTNQVGFLQDLSHQAYCIAWIKARGRHDRARSEHA